jgi:hypothetical protein
MCLNYQGTEIDVISQEEFEQNVKEEDRGGPRGSHAYELARLTVCTRALPLPMNSTALISGSDAYIAAHFVMRL